MIFLNPWSLWLLVPVALLALLYRRRERDSSFPLHSRIVISVGSGGRLVHWARIAALVLMTVALARPVSQSVSTIAEPSYEPVYLALDLSASMRAADRYPSRLEYSKEVIEELLQRERKHPFGLFGFTTNALILSPATMDHRLVDTALKSINPDFIITRGTDIGALVRSVATLPEERKRLVIFSDGGDGDDISDAINSCRQNGIVVYAVAAATKSGATIPKKGGGFVRDEKGRLVISMQNPSLAQLAEATGGAIVESDTAGDAAEVLISLLEEDRLLGEGSERVERRELFWIPLLAATILFLLTVVKIPLGREGALLAFAALLTAAIPSDADIVDLWKLQKAYELYYTGDYNRSLAAFESVAHPSIQRSFGEASAHYRTGAYKRSARILSSLMSDDPAVKAAIYYDLGNCAVKIGRYDSAKEFYIKSLQLRPDGDALANLSAILFLKESKKRGVKPAANRSVKPSGSSAGSQRSEGKKERESKAQGAAQGGGKGAKKSSSRPVKRAAQGTLKHPLGSKAYELINKGYIDERRPW